MKKVLILFSIVLILISCNSEKRMSDQIIEDILKPNRNQKNRV